ncbi:Hsp33 family molecular chaperone HslO [Geobacter sp. DSM 9736]|uniref:Hsp33 family molecular chaperone HslO n=1 Tax=Geobacter sp. DSM 9736 TaxID=1277350 RepID=UPI000B507B42|nr:Hsp33 family molecular chaperone HslO [Geobacter sp. DSM 9736]SNB47701.1 molecular chaperone Hsp33 [Geobacter sp. DSM 9736]
MSDYLVRILSTSGAVRGLACVTTELVREGCRRHGTWPTAAAALGRALSGGALMGALLKTGQRVALRFEGNGPLQKILVEAESNGAVRGYVGVPEVHLQEKEGKLDVGGALGRAGFLTVTKDIGVGEPYRGMVQLYSSEIAEDLAYYLTDSEQTPSAVGLGVFVEPSGEVSAAGGFLIQALPPGDDAAVDSIMEEIGRLPSITELLRQGLSPEELLDKLFHNIPYQVLEKRELAFLCSCSREKIERVLISLGAEDLTDLLTEKGGAEVTCEFCRERYLVSGPELEQLIAEAAARGGKPS